MPTNEWFKENPKISGYISSNLFQRFNEWMKERGIKKVSQGLTRILEEHLGVTQFGPIESTIGSDRLESLEAKFAELSQEFAAIKATIALSQSQTESNSEVDQSSNSQLSFLEAPCEEVDQIELIKEEEQVD